MTAKTLTVIKGSQLIPFIRYLAECGSNPAPTLGKCFCPITVDLASPHCCIPTKRFWQLIEETARVLKDAGAGWKVAATYGLQGSRYLGYQLENQPSLHRALTLYVEIIARHSNSAALELQIRGGELWVVRTNVLQRSGNFPQVELYYTGLLVHLIRHYLGAEWKPRVLSICGVSRSPHRHPLRAHCGTLLTGSDHLGIAVPINCLDQGPKGIAASIQAPGPSATALPTGNEEIFEHILHSYLSDYLLTRLSVCEILGMQPKTLERLLLTSDTNFRAIKNRVLMKRAKSELLLGRKPIGEIATLLQYSHQSAFTRAFEKQVGQTPEQFRNGANLPIHDTPTAESTALNVE